MKMTMDDGLLPIPAPPGLPLVGNMFAINPEFPLGSFINLAQKYGPIYQLQFAGQRRIIISSRELVNEVCDESRFSKKVPGALQQVRNGVHDGLFTAYPGEHNWELAHRILVPAFGPLNIRSMFDEMHDIASQLVLKWARHGPDHPITVTDDFTRLTLDTLALCAMDYRFNSFYKDELHPFIAAMGDFLVESGHRAGRPTIAQSFYREAQRKYQADIELLRKTSDDVVKNRRRHPSARKDLLNSMITGRDPRTGESLNDETTTNNMITFLIAGHETTSGLLSFVFYHLLQNPDAFRSAQQEIDDVIGSGPVTVDHLSKLPYITAILQETLRLNPTAPIFALTPLKDEVIGGKYSVRKDEPIIALLPGLHRDPIVWGDDADEWKPERMLDGRFGKLPKNAWKPFGNGARACIGRPFAWQEALLVIAMLLQNLDFVADDPSYHLVIKQTLTIKPKDFRMRAILRKDLTATQLERALGRRKDEVSVLSQEKDSQSVRSEDPVATEKGQKFTILYGSNTGTCEAFAQKVANSATARGFDVSTLPLDSGKRDVKPDWPTVIITASYEGEPPDNARHFYSWLSILKGNDLQDVPFAVFGCGHHDWAQTFQKIPTEIDTLIEKHGGKRICPRGVADAAAGDMFSDFETWEDSVFWPSLTKLISPLHGMTSTPSVPADMMLEVEVSTPPTSSLRQDVQEARVVESRVLTAPGTAPVKMHTEIELPSDRAYTVGDYLAVLPITPPETVTRVMKRFGMSWDSCLTIRSGNAGTLPTGVAIRATDLLGAYVELGQPCTRKNITTFLQGTKDTETRQSLEDLTGDKFVEVISSNRISPLDLLERYPSIEIPLGAFLAMLPPMRVRQYSISSSPLWNPNHVTLTYTIHATSSPSSPAHIGVASTYLSRLRPNDTLHVSVRPTHNKAFRLPTDASTPLIMLAAGSGIAPFRGFIQERAILAGTGRTLAPALLFIGCHAPGTDDIYLDELKGWAAVGAVDLRWAYSQKPEESKGCKYVQDRLWAAQEEVVALWNQGARIFVCGSRALGEGVRETCLRIAKEEAIRGGKEGDPEKLVKWFEGVRSERFATDVFV